MGGLLQGLGSFAGGLATGLQQGQQMKNSRDANARAQQEADDKHDTKVKADRLQADVAAAYSGAGPTSTRPHLAGPGYKTPEEAVASMAPPPAAPAAPGAQVPTPTSAMPMTQAMGQTAPADPLAPLPDAPQQAMPSQAPAPAPAAPAQPKMVPVRDTITGQYHLAPEEDVRPPSPLDRAQAAAEVYFRNGKVSEGMQLLNEAAQTAVNQRNVNKQKLSDDLALARADPTRFGQVVSSALNDFGLHMEVQGVMIPDGKGGSYPALQINQPGSATPPMYLGADGTPSSAKPNPGDYALATGSLQKLIRGGDISDVVSNILTFRGMAASQVYAREGNERANRADGREERRLDLDLQMQPGRLQAQSDAHNSSVVSQAATRQGMANDTARVGMAADDLYGTDGSAPGGLFGANWKVGQGPGAPRDGGTRSHKGTDLNGMPVGTPVAAPKAGKVIRYTPNDGKAGNLMVVRYDDGTENTFMHLQGIHKDFPPGTSFTAGQNIAFAGNSGNASTAGTNRAVLHVQGSAGIPRPPLPSKADRTRLAAQATQQSRLVGEAIKWVEQNTDHQPGTPQYNAAVQQRVHDVGQFYGQQPQQASGGPRIVPFKG